MPDLNIKTHSTNSTTFKGELSEAELTKIICEAVCEKMGVDPGMPGVSFRAGIYTDSGGLTQRKYLAYEVIIDHTKQPTVTEG